MYILGTMQGRRRQEINSIASKVRRALDLDHVPFDVEEAVRRLGGRIEDVYLDGSMEALIQKGGESFLIKLAPVTSSARRAFSIAHELGHLFLHMGFKLDEARWHAAGDYQDGPKYRFGFSEEEFEAHEFAAGLLMPESVFRSEIQARSKDGRVDLGPIADKFGVSTHAIRTRGQWLGCFRWA